MSCSTTCDGRGDRGAHGGRHPPARSGQVEGIRPPLTPGTDHQAGRVGGHAKRPPVAEVLPGAEVVPAYVAPLPPSESLRVGPGTKTGGGVGHDHPRRCLALQAGAALERSGR